MRLNKGLAGLLSASLALIAIQAPASAGGFGGLIDSVNNTVNRVNNTVYSLDRTINGTAYTINSLSETLGLNASSNKDSINAEDPTGQVLQVYRLWYDGMPAADRETVSWLVMQHAQNQAVTFDTVATSDWFKQKPAAQQSQAAANFFKLQNILEATAQDRSRFLAYAFCVNGGGGESCQ